MSEKKKNNKSTGRRYDLEYQNYQGSPIKSKNVLLVMLLEEK